MSQVDNDEGRGSGSTGLPWSARYAMNALTTVIVSAVFASGATLLLVQTGLVDLDKAMKTKMDGLERSVEQVQETVRKIDDAMGPLGDRLEGFERRQSSKITDNHKETTVSLTTLKGNTTALASRARELVDMGAFTSGLDNLRELSWEQDELMAGRLSTAQEDRAKGRELLLEAMRDIADTHARRQKAIEKMIDEIEKEGKEAIEERDLARVTEWIALAHFVVSSLPLPERDGILFDRSVVASEIDHAKSKFSKTSGEKAFSHARRALVAVRAVQRVVHGEQL